jgi:hypothetical protein
MFAHSKCNYALMLVDRDSGTRDKIKQWQTHSAIAFFYFFSLPDRGTKHPFFYCASGTITGDVGR